MLKLFECWVSLVELKEFCVVGCCVFLCWCVLSGWVAWIFLFCGDGWCVLWMALCLSCSLHSWCVVIVCMCVLCFEASIIQICCFCVLQGFGCGVVVECLWYGCGLHIQGDFWRGVHLHCVCSGGVARAWVLCCFL